MCRVLTARREDNGGSRSRRLYSKQEDDAVLQSDVEVTNILNGYWQSDINVTAVNGRYNLLQISDLRRIPH